MVTRYTYTVEHRDVGYGYGGSWYVTPDGERAPTDVYPTLRAALKALVRS